MPNLTPAESALVTTMQAKLASVKADLFAIETAARQLANINRTAGRLVASNAANRLQGAVASARGNVISAHADASDALLAAYDDGGVVVQGGGGGR